MENLIQTETGTDNIPDEMLDRIPLRNMLVDIDEVVGQFNNPRTRTYPATTQHERKVYGEDFFSSQKRIKVQLKRITHLCIVKYSEIRKDKCKIQNQQKDKKLGNSMLV